MKTRRPEFFGVRACRVFLYACIAAGAIASQSASAALQGEAAYHEKFVVPAFVPDVRAVIVNAASIRGWKLIEEQPGVLTFELRHAKSHLAVVVTAHYSKSEFSFRRGSVKTFNCDRPTPCGVDPDKVHRWIVSLRREAGVQLLRLAIQDAGGSVPAGRAAVVEAE